MAKIYYSPWTRFNYAQGGRVEWRKYPLKRSDVDFDYIFAYTEKNKYEVDQNLTEEEDCVFLTQEQWDKLVILK